MRKITRKIILFSLTTALFQACSSGGSSGGGDGGGYVGTGFLKINLPDIASVGIQSTVSSQAPLLDSEGFVESTSILSGTLSNQNTSSACVGSPSNIPFVICVIESLGINAIGTYNGLTPKGESAQVVVSDITGNISGYTLQAVVTLTNSSEIAFKYQANALGTKGLIEIVSNKIFTAVPGSESLAPEDAIRVVWDSSSTPQKLEYTGHNTTNAPTNSVVYMKALYDASAQVADIGYRSYSISPSANIARGKFNQTRSSANLTLAVALSCQETSSPVDGVNCFQGTSGAGYTLLDPESNSQQLICGTVPTTGLIEFNLTESLATSGSLGSSNIAASGSYSDGACETLKTSSINGAAFSVRVDKDAASADTLNGMMGEVRSKSYSDLKLLTNPGFLAP